VSKDGSVRVPVSRGRLTAYAVDKAIGKGKFSTVYRARRVEDGALVALKRIRIFDALDDKSRDKVSSRAHGNMGMGTADEGRGRQPGPGAEKAVLGGASVFGRAPGKGHLCGGAGAC